MSRQIISIIVFLVLIIILVGAGILLYRFLSSFNNSTVAVLTINDQGKFTSNQLNLENDKPFRIKNDDDEEHIIKNKDDNSTLVEVEANSTSRELTTDDNSRAQFYISSKPDQVATVITGNAPSDSQKNETENKNESGAVQAVDTQAGQPLPNTGPESFLIAPIVALFGYVVYRLSGRILKG